jgi:potassium/hydrogen antiporter
LAKGEIIVLGMNTWQSAWLVILIILCLGLVMSKLTERPRIPDVAGFLILGILIGPQVLNLVSEPGQSEVNQFILNFGATLILFGGGRATKLKVLKKVWLSLTLLAVLGVVITMLVTGLAVKWAIGGPWIWCFLLAAVISPTDPATLIPVFARVPIIERLQVTMEAESALNDATGSVLAITMLAALTGHQAFSLQYAAFQFGQNALVGLLAGAVVGIIALWFISENGWGIFQDFPSITLFIAALGAFSIANALHGSGFMAAFTAGVLTGNDESFGFRLKNVTEEMVNHFESVVNVMMRMLIFVLLGTQVDFSVVLQFWKPGLFIVAVFIFAARPLTVILCTRFDKIASWAPKERLFMMWVRETGVIPAALVGVLAASHVPGAQVIASVVFMAILLTLLVQATTTAWLARKLGLLRIAEDEEF